MLSFNEPEWLKLLFLLSDTQTWINEMERDLFRQVPGSEKKKLFRKTYYITAASLAHILERHYHKIARHFEAGKFTIPVPDILYWLRQASFQEVFPIPGNNNYIREINTGTWIGFDKTGNMTSVITVITGPGGCIKTAFPGHYKDGTALFLQQEP